VPDSGLLNYIFGPLDLYVKGKIEILYTGKKGVVDVTDNIFIMEQSNEDYSNSL